MARIKIAVSNAAYDARFAGMTDEQWDRMMAVNLKGPFLCSQVVVRHLVSAGRGGKIVNIASVESEAVCPDQARYAASKGGLLMLTRALAGFTWRSMASQ